MNPTYLYIKTCNHCGKKYFGKTTHNDPYKYKGSGKIWTRHLKKHKCSYSTEIIGFYENKLDLVAEALVFSAIYNIVESNEWFNLIDENGLDGGATFNGKKHTEESKQKMRIKKPNFIPWNKNKKNVYNKETLKKMSDAKIGKERSKETKKILSKKLKNNCNNMGFKKKYYCCFHDKHYNLGNYNKFNHHNGFCLFN